MRPTLDLLRQKWEGWREGWETDWEVLAVATPLLFRDATVAEAIATLDQDGAHPQLRDGVARRMNGARIQPAARETLTAWLATEPASWDPASKRP